MADFDYQRLAETVAPIFDRDRGRRLEMMRKSLLLSQAELADRLGVNQQMITKIERGITPVSRKPITLAQFYAVFGCATEHILYGRDEFNYEEINRKYWIEKDRRKGNSKARRPTNSERRRLRRRARHLT
jgi:transcriptional regulator with XRE-family HTH domain